MARPPRVADLYGGDPAVTDGVPTANSPVGTPKPGKLASRHEAFHKAVKSAIAEGLAGDVMELPPDGGSNRPIYRSKRQYQKELANEASRNGLKKGHAELVAETLNELKKGSENLSKEWTLSSPIPTGIVPYDLEAPSKLIFPRPTPFRNSIPRVRGQGTSHKAKIIQGITGSGTGGITSLDPGFAENSTTVAPGSGLNLVRPNYISYEGYDASFAYVTSGLSDSLTWQSEYQGQGFDDVRSLSATALLYATMLAEERTILFARGTTANGYSGALGTPASVTLSGVSASVAPAGTITGATTLSSTSWVVVAGDSGDLVSASGQLHQGPATTAASVSVSAGQAIQVTVGSDVPGALGYLMYVASVQAGPYYYAGRTGYNVGYVRQQPTSGATTTSGAADQSARSTSYDGFFANLAASGGYTTRLNAPFSTTNPGVEFQIAFANLFDQTKSNPDSVWLNGYDRLQLSNALLNSSNVNAYRVFIQNDQAGNVTAGTVVQSLMNEVTGKEVPLNVHEWFPQGNALIRQEVLPLPYANVTETFVVACVQDMMQIAWPIMGFTYDSSTFMVTALVSYAPQWSGLVQGIEGTGVPVVFPSEGSG